jgi:acetyl-CoA C-acetyltransferase
MCGSGMKAAMLAHDSLVSLSNEIIVAGGMESMTNAPYLLPKARAGLRMGHGQVIDHMFYDGLEDAYEKGRLMGTFAEECARAFLHAGIPGQIRDHLAAARAKGEQGRLVRLGDHAARHQGGQGREVHRDGRAAVQGEPGEDPDAQARVPQGRHGDRGKFILDLRRRGRAGADAPLDGRKAGPSPIATIIGHATHAQAPPCSPRHRSGNKKTA